MVDKKQKFKVVTLENKIIHDVGKIEFFTDGTMLANDEIPVKELLESTGLKDKNGKEIFVGDIVGGTLPDGTTGKSPVFRGYNCYQPFSYLSCRSEELEIIGNCYDNPELLE